MTRRPCPCMVCEKRYAEIEQAEVCERRHAAAEQEAADRHESSSVPVSSSQERALIELLCRADSYLSLLWHRHVPWDRKDVSLTLDVERTIGDLRKAYERMRSAGPSPEGAGSIKAMLEEAWWLGRRSFAEGVPRTTATGPELVKRCADDLQPLLEGAGSPERIAVVSATLLADAEWVEGLATQPRGEVERASLKEVARNMREAAALFGRHANGHPQMTDQPSGEAREGAADGGRNSDDATNGF